MPGHDQECGQDARPRTRVPELLGQLGKPDRLSNRVTAGLPLLREDDRWQLARREQVGKIVLHP
ncbi:hypothetical protein [Nocardia grenadensis]|uniref:hypothetical protein n=1 Tax=Nocardia grenadensis TaxID=931537 RepID=UPI0007A3A240|nr:hypothetical protein [Nocardia grenadensis]